MPAKSHEQKITRGAQKAESHSTQANKADLNRQLENKITGKKSFNEKKMKKEERGVT